MEFVKVAKMSAVSFLAIGLTLIGCYNGPIDTDTGIQEDGTYRVTDYDSHVEMCKSDFVDSESFEECVTDAFNVWYVVNV